MSGASRVSRAISAIRERRVSRVSKKSTMSRVSKCRQVKLICSESQVSSVWEVIIWVINVYNQETIN